MRVLGIDTSTLRASIALVDEDRVIAEMLHDTSERRSADLLVSIDALCNQAALAPADLDAVAIGAGPGSFTGLRIGMATAKGIAFAAGKPLWSVSSLAALAHDARRHTPHPRIVAVLDARRDEVFARVDHEGALVDEERVMAPAELVRWVTTFGECRFAGDALAAYPDVLAPLADTWIPVATPSGIAVAQLALAGSRVDVLASGAPMYIRPSEAEIRYPDGVPGALRRR
jgi:tRNA threonylcarbamoyladenosine biosynthesis protein TsaB